MMLFALLVTTLLVAYANGANDNVKATATLFGSGSLGYRSTLGLATASQLAGSLLSLFVATKLLPAFGGKGLVDDAVAGQPEFLLAVALGGGLTVLLATRLAMPISTTHALLGGLLGAGLALSPSGVDFSHLVSTFLLPLLVSPMLALLLAALLYPAARFLRLQFGLGEESCLCLDRVPTLQSSASGIATVADSGLGIRVDEEELCEVSREARLLGFSFESSLNRIHAISAAALGLARGLNDTPKVVALLAASRWSGLDLRSALALVAVTMSVGGWLHSRRLADTLGHDITDMNRGQGLVANLMSSALVIGASLLGRPVSTTHVSAGAIFGIGWTSERRSWSTMGEIALAWILTLPMGLLLGWIAAAALRGN